MKKKRGAVVGVESDGLPKIHHDRPALILILILALSCVYRRFLLVKCSVTEPTMHPPFYFV